MLASTELPVARGDFFLGTENHRTRSPALGRVRMRLTAQTNQEQALGNPRPPMPAIKAVGEFFQIELPPGVPVIGPINKRFR